MSIYILIPAYKPDEKLIQLLKDLDNVMPVLVVDDGSGQNCAHIFDEAEALGATVLHHPENKGKGAALKTGIKYLADKGAQGIITADSDGQHTPEDIQKIADAMAENPDTFITGGRDFSQMPPRSKFGNTITCWLFRLTTRIKITDTQTGLRGLPSCMFENLLSVEGDRYEYEMNVLLKLREWGTPYKEIPISTVYIGSNESSHFQPINDGLKIFLRVIEYALSSLSCTFVDYLIYILLLSFKLLQPAWCFAVARICSSTLNYQLNRRIVFKGKPSVKSAFQYAALVVIILIIGSTSVNLLTKLGIGGILSKVIIDTVLFILNYVIQNKVIFAKPKPKQN